MIIFYYGNDDYQVRAARDTALEKFKAKHPGSTALTLCDGSRDDDLDSFEGACKTASFFDDLRLIVLSHPFATPAGADRILAVLLSNDIPAARDIVVLATASGTKAGLVKEHPELAKIFLAGSPVKEFHPPTERELPAWIRKECATRGARIVPEAASALARTVGTDTWTLAHEIEKLAVYAGDREIGPADVALLVPASSGEEHVFALTDALAAHDRMLASSLLFQQLARGQDPNRLLSLIAWHLRTLLVVRNLADRGKKAADISRLAQLKPFVVNKALRTAPIASTAVLQETFCKLCAIDTSSKTGISDTASELFSFILSMPRA